MKESANIWEYKGGIHAYVANFVLVKMSKAFQTSRHGKSTNLVPALVWTIKIFYFYFKINRLLINLIK